MRLNWNQRQSPTDLDDSPNTTPDYSFDYTRGTKHGEPSWPEKHGKEKFGPALVKAAWKSGLVVVAYVEGFDHPVAVTDSRWNGAKCYEVKTLEGWRIPSRLRTLTSTAGLKSTGEWVEPVD